MAINTQNIRVDLNPGKPIPVAYAHQNDNNREFTFTLYNNGVAYTPSGTTAKFGYKSPIVNGQYSVIAGNSMATGTVSGNTVTVTLPNTYTQVHGVGLLTMILTTSGNTLRPVNIKFVVQSSADGDDVVLGASDWPAGLYEYMDDWLAENEPTEIANLKSDLTDITVPNYQSETVDISALGTPMSNVSGFAQSATRAVYSANNGTDCILYEITEPTTFYFGSTNADYLACVVLENPVGEWKTSGSNTYRDGESATRYRKTDGNLPSQANPYTTSNASLLITITSNRTAPITLITSDGVVLNLAQTTGNNDKKAMSQKAVTDVIGTIASKAADSNYRQIAISAIGSPIANAAGYVSGNNGGYGSNNGTTSYIMDITEETSLYFGSTTAPYLSLVIIEEPTSRTWTQSGSDYYLTGTSATRKRNTDNNLPTENSPYTSSDAVLVLTITTGKSVNVYVKGQVIKLSNDVYLNTTQLEQLLVQSKKPLLQYVPVDASALPNSYYKQELDIYIPTTVGYIKYLFVRNELDDYNANNWRLEKAFACDNSKAKRFLVVNSGEYEMALQINGRSDFIGGIAHGDEVINDITFLVNGNEVSNITSLTNLTEFDELKIVETTDLYDPADGATLSTRGQFSPCAKHGKEYTFTKDGIRLRQFVKWLKAETLTASYMTMFPIVRGNDSVSAIQITDTFYADDDYLNYDVSTIVGASGNAWAWRKDIEHAVIWSDESGVSAEVIMLKQPMIENNGARQFKVQDSSAYNKLYWSVCGVGGALYDASVNERFVTETLYKVDICK